MLRQFEAELAAENVPVLLAGARAALRDEYASRELLTLLRFALEPRDLSLDLVNAQQARRALDYLVGFTLSYGLAMAIIWGFRNAKREKSVKGFKAAQATASTLMAVGHGLQDAQKTMGVITLALVVGGFQSAEDDGIQSWVKIAAALAIAAGTYAGGWRIMATLGRRVTDMDLPRGLAAQSVASTVLYVMAIGLQAPISTTHTITSSVLGAGATRGKKFVRWGVVGNILGAWVLTLPASAAIAAAFYFLLSLI